MKYIKSDPGKLYFVLVILLAAYGSTCAHPAHGISLPRVKEAAPEDPRVQPQQSRRVLIFPAGREQTKTQKGLADAVRILGDRSGAYTAVVADSASVFRPVKLRDIDAVCLTGNPASRVSPDQMRNLIAFVRNGGGFVGIGTAARGCDQVREYSRMIGGRMVERLETGKHKLEVEDPYHTCCRMFGSNLFPVEAAPVVFGPQFSRGKLHVLLSLKPARTEGMNWTDSAKKAAFPVSWVRKFGKGRVFYANLGTDTEALSNTILCRHYLAGIQFALGDLTVNTVSSASYGTGYMGDWQGERRAGDSSSSDLASRVIARGKGTYRARIFTSLGVKQELLAVLHGRADGGKVTFEGEGHGRFKGTDWTGTMTGRTFSGSYSGKRSGSFRLRRTMRQSPTLGETPPADATVLFGGKSLSGWKSMKGSRPRWKLLDIGAMEVVPGRDSIISKHTFQDARIHLEFRTPFLPEARGHDRGNSGVYLQGRYEIQILDSYGIEPECGECQCGSVCYVSAPSVNACTPPMQWQTYDIFFRAPRFDGDGNKVEDAELTLYHNGVKVQDGVKVSSPTRAAPREESPQPGGLYLQEHGHAVQYRNIWVTGLDEESRSGFR